MAYSPAVTYVPHTDGFYTCLPYKITGVSDARFGVPRKDRERFCTYCGRLHEKERSDCAGCGAPVCKQD